MSESTGIRCTRMATPRFRFVEVQVKFVSGETQFFFLETRSDSFYGPPLRARSWQPSRRKTGARARQYDLPSYDDWYDTSFQLNPDWPSIWRFVGRQTAVIRRCEPKVGTGGLSVRAGLRSGLRRGAERRSPPVIRPGGGSKSLAAAGSSLEVSPTPVEQVLGSK